MSEITLSEYLAFVFSEISKARDMADRYSKQLALVYAKDDVLKHFSVPRFKLAKMDLTMPVTVSGVEVSSLLKFGMNRQDFAGFIIRKVLDVVGLVRAVKPGPATTVRTDGIEARADGFHQELTALPDPSRPESAIKAHWTEIIGAALTLNGIPDELLKLKEVNELLNRALLEVIETIKSKWSVPKGNIERLLINAETNVVKDGSGGTSVFTIKAELIEEGLMVRSVRDERTGAESSVVEFE